MTARIRLRDSGGTLRTITRIRMRDSGGTLRTISRVRMRDSGGTLRTVFQAFAAVLPALVTGSSGTTPSEDITTSSALVALSGGTAAYTYAWTLVESDGVIVWTISTATAASTSFVANDVPGSYVAEATFMITVTDANGLVATATVLARATNTNTS